MRTWLRLCQSRDVLAGLHVTIGPVNSLQDNTTLGQNGRGGFGLTFTRACIIQQILHTEIPPCMYVASVQHVYGEIPADCREETAHVG